MLLQILLKRLQASCKQILIEHYQEPMDNFMEILLRIVVFSLQEVFLDYSVILLPLAPLSWRISSQPAFSTVCLPTLEIKLTPLPVSVFHVHGAHFTNNFSITVQMWWKINFTLIQIQTNLLLQIFAHRTRVAVLWHVQKPVWLSLPGWE